MVGALSISPLFSFPFYGHLVSELFITTHGFLSLSPRLHDYIYKTQYIAPLRIKVIIIQCHTQPAYFAMKILFLKKKSIQLGI